MGLEQKAMKTSQEEDGRRCGWGRCRDKLGKNREERREHIEKHRKEYEMRGIGVRKLDPPTQTKTNNPMEVGKIMKSRDFLMLSQSARKIIKALCELRAFDGESGVGHKQIRERTGLKERKVKESVRELKQMGMIDSAINLKDTRRSHFFITMREEE